MYIERYNVPGIVEIIEDTTDLVILDSKDESSLVISDKEPDVYEVGINAYFLASKLLTLKFGDNPSFENVSKLLKKKASRGLNDDFDQALEENPSSSLAPFSSLPPSTPSQEPSTDKT